MELTCGDQKGAVNSTLTSRRRLCAGLEEALHAFYPHGSSVLLIAAAFIHPKTLGDEVEWGQLLECLIIDNSEFTISLQRSEIQLAVPSFA
jgi:hypothetical protein